MPILDPSLQFFILHDDKKTKDKNGYSFFLKYLQIASRNIYQNFSTIEASTQFKNDLQDSISFINEELGCNFTKEDFINRRITNYYKYLFDNINIPDKIAKSKKYFGFYKIFSNQHKYEIKLYQPSVLFSEYHSWYLSDSPIAILCIKKDPFDLLNDHKEKESIKDKIFQLIKIEIDLMKAANFTLVLCYNFSFETEDFLHKIIKDDQFSELHIDIFFKEKQNDEKLNDIALTNFFNFMKDNYIVQNNSFQGFMYLYSYYCEEYKVTWVLSNYFQEISRTKFITFSIDPEIILIDTKVSATEPFIHSKTGFNNKFLQIYVSYVPYKDNDKTKTTQVNSAHILAEDFLNPYFDSSNIIFDINYGACKIEVDDIHLVRPDLFVKDTLALIPIDEDQHKSINTVEDKIIEHFKETEKQQIKYMQKFGKKEYKKCIRRVIFAYTYLMRKKNKNFSLYKTQIYTIIDACKSILNIKDNEIDKSKNKNDKKSSGIVYEIKTGEGKTCIITIITAVAAIKKFTVHVVSSNIELCMRDYEKSYEFFKTLNLTSGVLLHKNELEQYRKNPQFYESELYYSDDTFYNSLRMNFTVCGIDNENNATKKVNIVFSTFVNLECFYLHIMENMPAYIDAYFGKSKLLIDEVDSILLDEITNGTIISREMKSNAKEVLSSVYEKYKKNVSVREIYEEFQKNPFCKDIEESDIDQMIKEIELVHSDEFTNGKKYSIEEYSYKNTKRFQNIYKKTVMVAEKIADTVSKIKDVINCNFDLDLNEEEEEDSNEEEDLNTDKIIKRKRIIPFDYDHKGILEPNKEFSGFIPQFIALKEQVNHPNIVFKNISISYLYLSHPFFAQCYQNICGFTGTAGNENDKTVFQNNYNLSIRRVPRHTPSYRVDLPTIICTCIDDRNQNIINDINDFSEILEIQKINYKKIDGKTKDKINNKPLRGEKGVVILGTNICGRGTDIECSPDCPLHVIVTFYTTNTRVIEQAFGRTARNGQNGTCRCICLEEEKLKINQLSLENINNVVNIDILKKQKLDAFIRHYKKIRPWIFDFKIDKFSFNNSLTELRRYRINVNRTVAYNFKFPLIMSYKTFMDIQAQKILSIFNCPNCKYSWRIFLRYIREMILQSWSLMIKRFDKDILLKDDYLLEKEINILKDNLINILNQKKSLPKSLISKEISKFKNDALNHKEISKNINLEEEINNLYKKLLSIIQYPTKELIENEIKNFKNTLFNVKEPAQEHLEKEIQKLKDALNVFLPEKTNLDMISTYIHICEYVKNKYEDQILDSFTSFRKHFKLFEGPKSTILQLGFKPYSLLTNSGARISNDSINKTNFIKDPELSYERKMPNHTFSLLSITERVDDIFNKILQEISKFLGNKIFLKLFLRRTLAGCEFGICLDLPIDNRINDPFIIIDQTPLLLLTLYVHSFVPILGGILIFGLVFLAYISFQIFQYIQAGAPKLAKKIYDKLIMPAIQEFIPSVSRIICEKIINLLDKILQKQIDKMTDDDKGRSLFQTLKDILCGNFTERLCNFSSKVKAKKLFKSNDDNTELPPIFEIKLPSFLKNVLGDVVDAPNLLKISILLILSFAAFLKNFIINKKRIQKSENDAKKFDSTFDSPKKEEEDREDKINEIANENKKTVYSELKEKEAENDKKDIEKLKNEIDKLPDIDSLIPSHMIKGHEEEEPQKKKKLKKKKSKQIELSSLKKDDNTNSSYEEYKMKITDIISLSDTELPDCYYHISSDKVLTKIEKQTSKDFVNLVSYLSSSFQLLTKNNIIG